MVAQGLENTIKVKLNHVECGQDITNHQYIHFLPCIIFSYTYPLISGPKMAENSEILSIMAAQGLANTIKVKLANIQCGPGICHDHYMHFILCILFSWT